MGTLGTTRARRALACAGIAGIALGGVGCAPPPPPDLLARRCAEVLDLRHLALSHTRWQVASRRGTERTLRFEGVRVGSGDPIRDTIRCVFEDRDPWRLERTVVGARILSEAELALVNADLLLRDLSEHPQRLEGSRDPT